MSRTDKDAPDWVRGFRAPASERYEYHAEGCPHAEASRTRYAVTEKVVGTERVRKTFMKMRDARHLFFGAEVVSVYHHPRYRAMGQQHRRLRGEGNSRYHLVYDEDAHPGAEPVERDTPFEIVGDSAYRYVTYSKWVEVPIIEKTYVPIEDEAPSRECDLSPGNTPAQRGRDGSCHAYPHMPHHCHVTKEMRRVGYYGPQRAYVRQSLREAMAEYNTYGETDVEPWTDPSPHQMWCGGYWD